LKYFHIGYSGNALGATTHSENERNTADALYVAFLSPLPHFMVLL